MSVLKKLAGQTALYGISSILARLINYLLVPIHTSVFHADDFSIITKVYAFVAFLNVVYTFGMETTFFRFASKEPAQRNAYFSQCLTVVGSISVVFTVLLVLFAGPIVSSIGYAGKEIYVYAMAITMLADSLAALPLARLRLEGRPIKFVTIRLLGIGLTVLLNAFFYLLARPASEGQWGPELQQSLGIFYNPTLGVAYVFLANMLANGIMLLLLLPAFRQFVWLPIGPAYRQLLSYSWPLFFMGLAGMTDEMLSRTILDHYLPVGFYPGISNEAALGIFGACYKLSIFMSLAIQAFRYAADPFFFDKAGDKQSPKVFAQVMHAFIVVCLVLFLGVSLNLWWLAPIFLRKASYLTGLDVVPVLLLANMTLGIYYNLSIWFKITDKTQFSLWLSALGVVITIIGNLVLIPLMGYMGSAYTTLICYVSMSAACWWLGQRYWPVPYQWLKSGLFVALSIGLYYAFREMATSWHPALKLCYAATAVALLAGGAWVWERKQTAA